MDLEMRSFIKWQLNQEKRHVCQIHLIIMVISFAVFALYKLAKGVCFQIVTVIMSTPDEVHSFLGIGKGAETGNIGFFLGSTMAIMSVILILSAIYRTARIAYRDDKNGMIYLMLNQWYSREQLFHVRYAVAMISFVAGYLVWFLELVFLAIVGSLNGSQRLNNIGLLFQIMLASIGVGTLLISLTFFWLYFSRENIHRSLRDVAVNLMVVSLIFGNMYKVRDLIAYFIVQNGGNPVSLRESLRFLDYFTLFSPFSWINPYRGRTGQMFVVEILICLLGSISLFVLTNYNYKRCSFLQ